MKSSFLSFLTLHYHDIRYFVKMKLVAIDGVKKSISRSLGFELLSNCLLLGFWYLQMQSELTL